MKRKENQLLRNAVYCSVTSFYSKIVRQNCCHWLQNCSEWSWTMKQAWCTVKRDIFSQILIQLRDWKTVRRSDSNEDVSGVATILSRNSPWRSARFRAIGSLLRSARRRGLSAIPFADRLWKLWSMIVQYHGINHAFATASGVAHDRIKENTIAIDR